MGVLGQIGSSKAPQNPAAAAAAVLLSVLELEAPSSFREEFWKLSTPLDPSSSMAPTSSKAAEVTTETSLSLLSPPYSQSFHLRGSTVRGGGGTTELHPNFLTLMWLMQTHLEWVYSSCSL
jgi:hypothetical protein